jgi:Domain of unknown function (DUF4157)
VLALQRVAGNRAVGGVIQAWLGGPRPDDPYERQADEMAARVPQADGPAPSRGGRARGPSPSTSRAEGAPLDDETRAVMERHLGHDFGDVRVHAGGRAVEAARSIRARAYTVGNHVVFGEGAYAPGTSVGRRLLAHELAHVAQQTRGGGVATGSAVQRSPEGERAGDERGARATDFGTVAMEFDGADLIVLGDGREIMRFSGQSGRPVRITEEHAAECGANPAVDTYMNDARFVGIKDFGPIPEGSYSLSPPAIARFTSEEQRQLTLGGIFGPSQVTVGGQQIHAGDWGSGRVALQPRGRLREGPCGNVQRRSGFFLHGGILAGSSGCIDIGGGFDQVADFLQGYRRTVVVKVQYKQPPPSVGFITGLSGAVAYGRFGVAHGPSLRLGAEFSSTGQRALASVGYDVVLQWAGGAVTAGARLDVPFTDREAFVRAGLSGGLDFRVLGPLYGRVFGGYSAELTGPSRGGGAELGGGLRLDLNRVQLEALYNVLRPASDDERVHQALVQLGFRF